MTDETKQKLIDVVNREEGRQFIACCTKSDDGYSCPFCEASTREDTQIASTQPKFIETPDPHYEWSELHECKDCGNIYYLDNAT